MTRLHRTVFVAFAVAVPIPLASADDAGVAASSTAAPPSAPPASSGAPAPASLQPAGEGEGEEGDHVPPAPVPAPPKPPPILRVPVVQKDGMARIPGGKFTMGSGEPRAPANERPARVVTVAPFWIDRTEVTVGAYRACVERGACAPPTRASTTCTYDLGDPQLPISCVSWSAARAYCLAAGKRLPREVEWELAARGTVPVRYPWGGNGTGCGLAVTLMTDNSQRSCSPKRPARVGTHAGGASPFGILDMSGNVEEWVADWYGEALADLSPRAGASHVLRGGGWLTPPSLSRTTSRNWGSVREAGPNVGFRCARDD